MYDFEEQFDISQKMIKHQNCCDPKLCFGWLFLRIYFSSVFDLIKSGICFN